MHMHVLLSYLRLTLISVLDELGGQGQGEYATLISMIATCTRTLYDDNFVHIPPPPTHTLVSAVSVFVCTLSLVIRMRC